MMMLHNVQVVYYYYLKIIFVVVLTVSFLLAFKFLHFSSLLLPVLVVVAAKYLAWGLTGHIEIRCWQLMLSNQCNYNKPAQIPNPIPHTRPISATCMEFPSKWRQAEGVRPPKSPAAGMPIKSISSPGVSSRPKRNTHMRLFVASVGHMPSNLIWDHEMVWVMSQIKSEFSSGRLQWAKMLRRFRSRGESGERIFASGLLANIMSSSLLLQIF